MHSKANVCALQFGRAGTFKKNVEKVIGYLEGSHNPDFALTWRRSPVRIRPSPLFFCQSATLEPSIEVFSATMIMARNKHNKEKKLHNSDEPGLSWQEAIDLLPEDEAEGGSESFTTSPTSRQRPLTRVPCGRTYS